MVEKSKISGAVLGASLLAFVAFAIYILYINSEVLYTAHDRSEFLFGTPFLTTLMSRPFGLMQYAGAWLTQYFYNPAVGSALLLIIWGLIFYVGSKAFRLQGSASALMLLPVAFLLTSVVDLGYWIYFLRENGYWVSHSLSYLVMLLLLWAARITPRVWHLAWYVAALLLYPVLGWYSMLFVLCLVLSDKLSWRELVGVVSLVFVGSLWHSLLYPQMKLEESLMAGFPNFVTPGNECHRLSVPFWMLAVYSVLLPLVSRYLSKAFVPAASAALGICFTLSLMFHNQNYIDEMRMVRASESDNWEEVIDIATENKTPTKSMIMLKNVALMQKGELLDRSFKLGNNITLTYNPDSLRVSLLEIAAPIVYYNYGLINEALRLSYECAVQAGFSPYYLKMIARCAHATGEQNLEKRFTTLLHHHPAYAHWQPAPVSFQTQELQTCYADEITGVEDSGSYLVNTMSHWYSSDSKLASEQALFYSMLRCDARRFWPSLRSFFKLHQGENFPVHAQEAYIMFIDKSPEEKRMMVPVEEEIYERYKQFWVELESLAKPGVKLGDVADVMGKNWGDTYWYYNIFGRKIY